jgi:peptidoglycan hydrolase CwlO-like protein
MRLAIWALILVSVVMSMAPSVFAATPEEEQKALEAELAVLEAEITSHETTIKNLKAEGKTLESEISRYNAKISKVQLQIKAVNLQITKLDQQIGAKSSEIKVTEGKIDMNRSALSSAVRELYETDQASLMEVLLANPKLSDFFGRVNDISRVQESLATRIDTVTTLKASLEGEREVLALQRSDKASLKAYQDAQRKTLEGTKTEKANLLTVTKGKESKYQEILKERKKTAAQIRSQIFKLLGGGELSFDAAYQLAKLAEGATGVRAALILAVLHRESALGKNVGQCGYQTAMSPKNIPIFLGIIQKLGLDAKTMKVSCPNADGPYGGAMGPAQFIPSTWILYENKISSVTGNNPVSPWRNADAFVATALYLKDAGAASNEQIAAAKYYCGSNWNKLYVCKNVYGKKVVEQAELFQEDIDVLTG